MVYADPIGPAYRGKPTYSPSAFHMAIGYQAKGSLKCLKSKQIMPDLNIIFKSVKKYISRRKM